MKYMKLGSKPDIFYTEEATRSVLSDVPTDLIIVVNNTRYLLHKFPLLLKCGLLQRLSSDADDPTAPTPVSLPDFPGGEEAFELCAKFCYGIAINLSAHNFLPAISAARFLRMTEAVAKGNFMAKLEYFFESCIVQGWKDSIVVLQTAGRLPAWSENPRFVRPCIDSVVEKILTQPSKVTWSFSYTRPGYNHKQRRSAPKDWWTEDISELELDMFRSIISAVRASNKLPPQLIGESLHVYACKHLPDPSELRRISGESWLKEEDLAKYRRLIESIVSMIPIEQGSVSGSFLLKLLKLGNHVSASPSTKAELVRRSGHQLEEATKDELISLDMSTVEAILNNFLAQFHQPMSQQERQQMINSMTRVAKIFDSYLQVIASNPNLSVAKFIGLAELLPEIARQAHDQLYRAVDTYLKEHSELSKQERQRLCRVIDCRKLSPGARSHAVTNDRMPLRTIVQLLFVEQERARNATSVQVSSEECHALAEDAVAQGRGRMPMERSKSVSELKVVKKKERQVSEKGEGSGTKPKGK